jgi:hypothetical protein
MGNTSLPMIAMRKKEQLSLFYNDFSRIAASYGEIYRGKIGKNYLSGLIFQKRRLMCR